MFVDKSKTTRWEIVGTTHIKWFYSSVANENVSAVKMEKWSEDLRSTRCKFSTFFFIFRGLPLPQQKRNKTKLSRESNPVEVHRDGRARWLRREEKFWLFSRHSDRQVFHILSGPKSPGRTFSNFHFFQRIPHVHLHIFPSQTAAQRLSNHFFRIQNFNFKLNNCFDFTRLFFCV